MSVVALFTWMATIAAGLVLFVIWIIEYDPEFQSAARTRLPVPVISLHAVLGLSGLMLWVSYLLLDQERLAWATVCTLGAVAVLGLVMAARWLVPRLSRFTPRFRISIYTPRPVSRWPISNQTASTLQSGSGQAIGKGCGQSSFSMKSSSRYAVPASTAAVCQKTPPRCCHSRC